MRKRDCDASQELGDWFVHSLHFASLTLQRSFFSKLLLCRSFQMTACFTLRYHIFFQLTNLATAALKSSRSFPPANTTSATSQPLRVTRLRQTDTQTQLATRRLQLLRHNNTTATMRADCLPNVSVAIHVNGNAIHEYHAESEDAKTALCYVEAVSGAEFALVLTTEPGYEYRKDHLQSVTFLDGSRARGKILVPTKMKKGHTSSIDGVHSHKDGSNYYTIVVRCTEHKKHTLYGGGRQRLLEYEQRVETCSRQTSDAASLARSPPSFLANTWRIGDEMAMMESIRLLLNAYKKLHRV
jgi:hypothetical protein